MHQRPSNPEIHSNSFGVFSRDSRIFRMIGLRQLDTIDQMKEMVRGMDGKRLRYKDLIA